jgi:hypothetical protein
MGKVVLAPLYISVAWTLMISYQLFTQTAVSTIVELINAFWPSSISAWLYTRIETVIFVHSFAWVFVLSSVIPSLFFRKQGSVLRLFSYCLALTLISFWLRDTLPLMIESRIIEQILTLDGLFSNPLFAAVFLLAPYLFMVLLDLHSRREERKAEKLMKTAEIAFLGESAADLARSRD